MIGVKFKPLVTFDRFVIRKRWSKINRTPIVKAGMDVRRKMRSSIRRRVKKRGKPSPKGQPPRSRRPGNHAPFKMIFSVPIKAGTAVVVGMVGFGGATPVPQLHEEGGTARRRVYVRNRQTRGDGGRFRKRERKAIRKTVRYPARPFAVPALEESVPRLPMMWKDSIKR